MPHHDPTSHSPVPLASPPEIAKAKRTLIDSPDPLSFCLLPRGLSSGQHSNGTAQRSIMDLQRSTAHHWPSPLPFSLPCLSGGVAARIIPDLGFSCANVVGQPFPGCIFWCGRYLPLHHTYHGCEDGWMGRLMGLQKAHQT
jgi:hypothetical protein